MRLSIRNRLPGVVASVVHGEAMAVVAVRLAGGQEVTAAITAEAVRDLGLAVGDSVTVLVKSTEVALATGPVERLSIRNRLPGRVRSVDPGVVMATAKIAIDGGGELTAAVTKDAVTELGLAADTPVTALVKATEVSLATG